MKNTTHNDRAHRVDTLLADLRALLLPDAPNRPQGDATHGGDLLYGAAAIGQFLGLTERQALHRAAKGQIPSFKVGHQVCATRAALTKWLVEQAAAGRNTTPDARASAATILQIPSRRRRA